MHIQCFTVLNVMEVLWLHLCTPVSLVAVYDVADPDRVIGQIRLTVESLAALQTVKHEMDQTGEESTA